MSDKKYKIILADPPWTYFNPKNNDPSMGGITYRTMATEEIMKLPVESIADKDCSLFLWATMHPKLKEALQVIEAWGFTYTTCAFVWIKLNKKTVFWENIIENIKVSVFKGGFYSGMGHWTNGNAELCLFAKKGHPKRNEKNVKQLIFSPVGKHSAKPQEIRNRIVRLMGNVSRIELFARDRVDDWDAFGDEIESDIVLDNNIFKYMDKNK